MRSRLRQKSSNQVAVTPLRCETGFKHPTRPVPPFGNTDGLGDHHANGWELFENDTHASISAGAGPRSTPMCGISEHVRY